MKEFKFSFSHGLSALSTLPEPFRPALPAEELDTAFKNMYPPDPLGEELADNARVWRVYRDEATKADAVMLDGWNKTLDILLVFAGLFSAVVTSFVGQSNTQLQPDSNAYLANALFHLVKSNASVNTLPAPPSLDAPPPSTVVWVNALWFTSLLLSLAVAFLCILAKQWIGEYVVRTTSTSNDAHDWSCRRAFYFRGLNAWGLPGFLSFLPVLLHISLFLFIAGLCLSMWAVSRIIALCLISVGGCLAVFYIIATLVPFWRPDCPSVLPLIGQLRAASLVVLQTPLAICIACFPSARRAFELLRQFVLWPVYDACVNIILKVRRGNVSISRHSSHRRTPFHLPFFDDDDTDHYPSAEFQMVPRGLLALQYTLRHLRDKTSRDAHRTQVANVLDADALRWLILECSDHDTVAVGYQALGAVVQGSPLAEQIDIDNALRNTISFERACTYTSPATERSTTEIMRILRSLLFIRPHVPHSDFRTDSYSWMKPLLFVNYPDMVLVRPLYLSRNASSPYSGVAREVLESVTLPFSDRPSSPTIQSTLVILLRIPSMRTASFLKLLLSASKDTLVANSAFIAGRLCGRHRTCLHAHLLGLCPELFHCLSEALCADLEPLLSESRRCYDEEFVLRAELVSRLLSFSPYSPSLFNKQYLLSCLTSEMFIRCLHDPSTIQQIAGLAYAPMSWYFTDLAHCVTAITGLARLCRHFALKAPRDHALAPELKTMIDDILICVVFLASDSHPHRGLHFIPRAREMLDRRQRGLIVTPYADFVVRAPWADIFHILPWASSHRLEIASFMIGALCSKHRNHETDTHQLGLRELHQSLIRLLQDGQATDNSRDMLCHFACHLIQLGRDLWTFDSDKLEEGGVTYFAGEISLDVLFLGPCATCSVHSNHNQRWDRETEVYLIDLCKRFGIRPDGCDDDADPDLQLLIEFIILGGMVDAV